jgi:hypothetical protein
VELGGYLKTMGSRCDLDTRCLLSAPGLSTATRLLLLRVRPVSGGRLSAELRFIDRARMLLVDRSAAIVEPGELATWAEQAATRIFTRANAPTRTLPPSPFPGRKPVPAQTAPTPPASVPRHQGVRGPDDEP